MALSVSTVWIFYGTALTRATRKAEAVTRFARPTSGANANFDVRSTPTKSCSFPSGSAHLGDVDVEEPDRIGFERLLGRLVALDIR